jgi:hypothetical protein
LLNRFGLALLATKMGYQSIALVLVTYAIIFMVTARSENRFNTSQNEDIYGNCCSNVIFESTGSIVGTVQDHILGSYDYYGEGEWDTYIYKQVNGEFWDNYLYFTNDQGIWFINQTPGQKLGFAMNQNGGHKCPEELPHDWVWYNSPVWTPDEEATVRCR